MTCILTPSPVLGPAMERCASGRIRKIRRSVEGRFNLPPDVFSFSCAYSERMDNIRVLIVDDVERVRQDLCTLLTLTGQIEIVGEARDGWEAVCKVKELSPQVVLMDLEMPVMGGIESTRHIRAIQPSCRVIALTIHAGERERQQALEAGMADVLVKGAALDVLLNAIRGSSEDKKARL